MNKEIKAKIIIILVGVIPLICIFSISFYFINWSVWNIESGTFVRAELHPERVLNVTWIVLENQTLMYGTHNPEVLDCVPGKFYWFGEGLISGNYGKRLLWVTDENPFVV